MCLISVNGFHDRSSTCATLGHDFNQRFGCQSIRTHCRSLTKPGREKSMQRSEKAPQVLSRPKSSITKQKTTCKRFRGMDQPWVAIRKDSCS